MTPLNIFKLQLRLHQAESINLPASHSSSEGGPKVTFELSRQYSTVFDYYFHRVTSWRLDHTVRDRTHAGDSGVSPSR